MPSHRKRIRHGKKGSRKGGRESSKRGRSGTSVTTQLKASDQDRQVRRMSAPAFVRGQCIKSLGTPALPFPSIYRAIFTCDLIGSVTAASASSGDYLVDLNSMFKPFSTGSSLPNPLTAVSGLYPSGYNTYWSANGPYSQYVVVGSAIRVELLTANAGDNLVFTVVPTGLSGAAYADITHAGQGAFAQSRLIGFGNGGRVMLNQSVSVAEMAGVSPREVIDNPNFGASYNATPSNRLYWQIWWATCDNSSTSGTLTYRVQVSYDCMALAPTWTLSQDDDVKESSPGIAQLSAASARVLAKARSDALRAKGGTITVEEEETPSKAASVVRGAAAGKK